MGSQKRQSDKGRRRSETESGSASHGRPPTRSTTEGTATEAAGVDFALAKIAQNTSVCATRSGEALPRAYTKGNALPQGGADTKGAQGRLHKACIL